MQYTKNKFNFTIKFNKRMTFNYKVGKIIYRKCDYMELLANKIRPKKLCDVIGQEHLIGEGKIIYNLIKNKKMFSCIFYGKPGIGKTTLANVIVNELGMQYRFLNATTSKIQDFNIVIEEAKMNGEMIVIIDEIHRMNKDKQDILLPYLETGLIILIGLTTSNPYHKINPAIRSRCQIFELHELSNKDIIKGLKRACKSLENINIRDDVLNVIANNSGGDFRAALNNLELAYYGSSDKTITVDTLKNINSKPIIFADKNEDGHYDLLSAFQKSIRGSDPDAALYYLGRLIEIGDLDSIYRRMSVIAYEDIGLANPSVGPKVMAAISASELVGLPEARIPLSVIVTELALSPKSNSAHVALDLVLNDIRKGNTGNVPNHIKTNSPDYKYPHDYPKYWVKQQYLPDNIKDRKYYKPRINNYENNLNKINKEMRN